MDAKESKECFKCGTETEFYFEQVDYGHNTIIICSGCCIEFLESLANNEKFFRDDAVQFVNRACPI